MPYEHAPSLGLARVLEPSGSHATLDVRRGVRPTFYRAALVTAALAITVATTLVLVSNLRP